jgi:hypothetical protein
VKGGGDGSRRVKTGKGSREKGGLARDDSIVSESALPNLPMTGMCLFSAWPFRFKFRALDAIFFPEGKAGNVLRGAFGSICRRLTCIPGCTDAKHCEIAGQCAYALTFEPRQQWTDTSGPSGLADWPRPFAFRVLHLDGKRIERDGEFYFDVVLFESPEKVLPYFVLAFRALVETGMGPARGRAILSSVEQLPTGFRFTTASDCRTVRCPGPHSIFPGARANPLTRYA